MKETEEAFAALDELLKKGFPDKELEVKVSHLFREAIEAIKKAKKVN